MLPDRSRFEVFDEGGLFGLRTVDSKYLVLSPHYKKIILSWDRSYLITPEDKKYEILLYTYACDMICLVDNHDFERDYYFVDMSGRPKVIINNEWEKTHHCHISNVLTGFIYGVATLEEENSDEYHSFRSLINTDGNVICSYCLDLKEFILNPLDYLNYDNYGIPYKWDPNE